MPHDLVPVEVPHCSYGLKCRCGLAGSFCRYEGRNKRSIYLIWNNWQEAVADWLQHTETSAIAGLG